MSTSRPHAWLWQNDTWADFRVSVHPEGPGAEPLYSLLLQSVVLASASPGHFRGHCTRLKEDTDTASVGEKRDRDGQRASAVYEYKLTLFPGEPEAVPKAVFCHLYTGALPDDVDQLIWMLRRADYLDLADTVLAVLQQLFSLGSERLTLQHAAILHSLPDLQSDTPHSCEPPAAKPADTAAPSPAEAPAAQQGNGPEAAGARAAETGRGEAAGSKREEADNTGELSAQLQELIDSLLLAHLQSAPAIATDAALLAQFCQLPLALVTRWVRFDEYEVDSGNTLAVLFTAWHDAQPEPPSEEQCKQLSELLPLAAVSVHYHAQVLQHLKWWRPPAGFPAGALACHMTAELLPDKPNLHGQWLAMAGGAAVRARATQRAKHTWVVTATQLEQLWRDQVLSLPPFFMTGYMVGLNLVLDYEDKSWVPKHRADVYRGPATIGIYQASALPPLIAQHLGPEKGAIGPEDILSTTVQLKYQNGTQRPRRGILQCPCWRHEAGCPGIPRLRFESLTNAHTGLVPGPGTQLTLEYEASYPGAPAV